MRFTAKIENGKINWHDTKGLAEHLNLIDSEEVYIDIRLLRYEIRLKTTITGRYYESSANNVAIILKKCTMYAKATSN